MEKKVTKNILLNPGPSTTTDTVKFAQVVPDICPREKEFQEIMRPMRDDLVKIVHGRTEEYTAVLFCGSGTICIDIAINSLLDKGEKALIIDNGSYSERAVEVCKYYGLPMIDLRQPITEQPDLTVVERTLQENPDIGFVYVTFHETGTGLLNPVREIGAMAHKNGKFLISDTTSAYAMIPINVYEDNIDICMASAQKGIQAMSGLSYIIGRRSIIEKSKNYPKRSYYCNLYMQYDFFNKTGEMHFTPPVQTIYAARQGIKEYFEEGESGKWDRHCRVMNAIRNGVDELGFREALDRKNQSGLVSAICYPDDPNWSFDKVHDYCYERGFTIYPGKMQNKRTFRLCALGAIDEQDIIRFWKVFKNALDMIGVSTPVHYDHE